MGHSLTILPIVLHDRSRIETVLRRNTDLNIYEIGDLDDFFWRYTTWYALAEAGEPEQILLFYTGSELPVLLGTALEQMEALTTALQIVRPFLPARFYAHLTPGAEHAFDGQYRFESHGLHHKMSLTQAQALDGVDTSQVEQLGPADLADLLALYDSAYPGNWFNPALLETGGYFGVREAGRLVSVAGVHVYSPHYRVAALGNITTLPDRRGRGLGTAVTAGLCRFLCDHIDHIGLNVKADNTAALACYRRLGFTRVADYEEFMFSPPC